MLTVLAIIMTFTSKYFHFQALIDYNYYTETNEYYYLYV
jgi:hypothetical protein